MSETRASEVLSMEVVVADGLSGYGPGEVIGWTDGRLLVRRGRREWHLGPDASVDLSEDGEVIVADVADPDRFLRLRFGPATGATFTNRVGWLALVGTAVLAGAWLGDMRVLAAALVVAAISAVWSWRSNDESLQRQTFIDHAELVGHGSVTMGSGGTRPGYQSCRWPGQLTGVAVAWRTSSDSRSVSRVSWCPPWLPTPSPEGGWTWP